MISHEKEVKNYILKAIENGRRDLSAEIAAKEIGLPVETVSDLFSNNGSIIKLLEWSANLQNSLNSNECLTDIDQVNRDFAVTRERIRQIEARALEKLRNPTKRK